MRVTLIHNPASGDDAQPSAEDLMAMLDAAGHQVSYRCCHDPDWITALDDPGEAVAIAGGDGTIALVARRMIGAATPLAVLPVGTANNIARTLGLSDASLEQQVVGWSHARRLPFDVGAASGPWGVRYFLESLGAGLFTQVMAEADASAMLATLAHADAKTAYGLQMLKESVHRSPSVPIRATLDGHDLSGSYVLFEVMNAQYIGPNLYLAPHGQPSDGLFDVVLATESERERLERCFSNWQNGPVHDPELPSYRGRRLRLRWGAYPLHVDDAVEHRSGLGTVPLDIDVTVTGGALEFLVPRDLSRLSSGAGA